MSRENVEIVRRFNEPHDGEDIIPLLRAGIDQVGPDPEPEAVLAFWADDPGWRYAHPEIEWDIAATGPVGMTASGPIEVARWWRDWSETWESYVDRMVEYRDLGEWVLAPTDVRAKGRGGIRVEMRAFQIFRVRDGKIAAMRAFLIEREALEAAGLRESASFPRDTA
jgi:ketosteroid isomerase-like protein